MHKSRLAGFIVDCRTGDLPAAAVFWGGALGMEVRTLPGTEGEKYVRLIDRNAGLHADADRFRPDRRHVESQILLRLTDLDDHRTGATAAPDGGVRALDRFDRQHDAGFDDDALSDVPAPDCLGDGHAVADVVPLRLVRSPLGERSRGRENAR